MEGPRYVVHPHYVDKLKAWLEMTKEIEGGGPLQYEMTALQVGWFGWVRGWMDGWACRAEPWLVSASC